MSRLFISYAREDHAVAATVRDWLERSGWQDDVFFDLDGIAGGAKWREALKRAASRCEAVILILSQNWMDSRVCWSEFQLAEKQRKAIVPIVIDDRLLPADRLPPELAVYQAIDQVNASQLEFEIRLQRALQDAGAGPENFPLPHEAAPYSGLRALTEKDAALFFGRDAEVLAALDTLREIRETGRKRMMVILGSSGAGKSSLLRAGVWARIDRNDRVFLALPVLRPGEAALTGATGLWQVLGDACNDGRRRANLPARTPKTRAAIADAVMADPAAVIQLLHDLKKAAVAGFMGALANAPSPVLCIDQGEELLSVERGAEAEQFLSNLRNIHAAHEDFITVIAVRSDVYPELQKDQRFDSESLRPFNLSPMSEGNLTSIITGPAARVGLQVEPALRQALLRDAKGADALPLLAFTLERLYLERLDPDHLKVRDLTRLGGIAGALALADAEVRRKARERGIPETALDRLLRRVFLPHLARVNEAGAFARRIAHRADFDPECLPVIDLLVNQRLLVTDQRDGHAVVEIAHEAILREWPLLAGWLDAERSFLEWREQLAAARRLCELGRSDLLSGRALVVAQSFLETRAADLTRVDGEFIERSIAAEEERRAAIEEQKEVQRRVELEAAKARERIALAELEATRAREDAALAAADGEKKIAAHALKTARRTRVFASVMALLVLVVGYALYDRAQQQLLATRRASEAEVAQRRAELAQRQSDSRRLARVSEDLRSRFGDNKALAISWLSLSDDGTLVDSAITDEAASALYKGAMQSIAKMPDHLGFILAPDGRHAFSELEGRESVLWRTDTLEPIQTFAPRQKAKAAGADSEDEEPEAIHRGRAARFATDGGAVGVLSNEPLEYRVYDIGQDKFRPTVAIPSPDRFGAEGYVDIVIAPDLKHLLLVTDDVTARLFDAERGTVDATLTDSKAEEEHGDFEGYVMSTFSPSGRYVAVSWWRWKESFNFIWDLRSRQPARVGTLVDNVLNDRLSFDSSEQFLSFSPWVSHVMHVTRSDSEYRDIAIGERNFVRDAFVPRYAFLADGASVPAALREYAEIFPATRKVCTPKDTDREEGEPCASVSPVTYPAMWALSPYKIAQSLGTPVVSYSAAENGRTVAVFDQRGSCTLAYLDLAKHRLLTSMPISVDIPCMDVGDEDLAIAPDGRMVFVLTPTTADPEASGRKTLAVYRLSPEVPDVIAAPSTPVAAMASDSTIVMATNQPGHIEVRDLSGAVIATASLGLPAMTSAIAPAHGGSQFAAGDWAGNVHLGAAQGDDLGTLTSHAVAISAVAFSRDDSMVATGGHDGLVRLSEVASRQLITTMPAHTSGISTLSFSPDGEHLASASFDGSVRIWTRVGRESAVLPHPGPVFAARYSPNGRSVATAAEDGRVRLWNLADLEHPVISSGHEGSVRGVQWGPTGELLLSWSDDRTARLWEKNGSLIHTLNGHPAALTHGVFAPDMTLVATGDRGGQVRLWDLKTGALLAIREAGSSPLATLGFMDKRRVLAASSQRGSLQQWPVMPGGLRERLEEVGTLVKAIRPLTNEECAQFYVTQLAGARHVCGDPPEPPPVSGG